MILTIWRHGEAERGARDRLRELTDAGRDDIGFACQQFHRACNSRGVPHPDYILYSPWIRTRQTAEVIAAAFTHARASVEHALQPGSDITAVDAVLSVHEETAAVHILLVSHQPLVSRLADHYLGGSTQVPPLLPGGLVTMSLDILGPGCGTLRFWAMPPHYEASE